MYIKVNVSLFNGLIFASYQIQTELPQDCFVSRIYLQFYIYEWSQEENKYKFQPL